MAKTLNIIIYIFLFIVLLILTNVLMVKQRFSFMFEWWDRYKCSDCPQYENFSLLNLYFAYTSTFFYYATKVLVHPVYQLTLSQIEFFMQYLSKFTLYYDEDNNQQGCLIPKHLINSVLFKSGEGNANFDKWVKLHNRDETKQWDPHGPDEGNGVYPGDDPEAWRALLSKWAGVDNLYTLQKGQWGINPDIGGKWATEWANLDPLTGHPDNFLASMGIVPGCVMIIGFLNKTYNDINTGLKFDSQSFLRLIGYDSTSNYGGWFGFLQNLAGSDPSVDNYANTIYASYAMQPNPPPQPCGDDTTGILSMVTNGISSGAGIAGLALFIGESSALWPLGPIVLAAAGTAVAGVSIAKDYTKMQNCQEANKDAKKAETGK